MKRALQFAGVVLVTLLAATNVAALKIDPNPEATTLSASGSPVITKPAKFRLHMIFSDAAESRDWATVQKKIATGTTSPIRFEASKQGFLALVLTGYSIADMGTVDLSASVRLIGPDGKVVYEHPDLARSAWAQPKRGVLTIQPHVKFTFDRFDKAGVYTYQATVLDRTTNEITHAEQKITLTN